MDGLTVPLPCEVPVTPGEEVTVRVAVGDYGPSVDSADGGIWSD